MRQDLAKARQARVGIELSITQQSTQHFCCAGLVTTAYENARQIDAPLEQGEACT